MADTLEEKVILSVELDTGGLTDQLVEIKSSIDGVKSKLKELSTEKSAFQAQGKDVTLLNQQIVTLEAQLKSLNTSQRQLQQTVQQSTAANNANVGSYEQLNRQWQVAQTNLKTMEGALQRNADGTYVLTAAYTAAAAEVGQMKDGLDKFNLTVNDGRTNVGNYAKSIDPLKTEVIGLRQEHRNLTNVMQGAIGVFSLLNIAGGEGSKVTELQKGALIGLVAIQGISEVRLGAVAAAELVSTSVRKAGTIATQTATVATGALASVQTFLQVQFGLTAIAARILAVAIAATGIGAIIIGVGLLASALLSMSASAKDSAKSIDTLTDAHNRFLESEYQLKLSNEKLEAQTQIQINDRKTEIELLKIRGATATEIYHAEIKLIDDQTDMLRRAGKTQYEEYHTLLNDKLILTAKYAALLLDSEKDSVLQRLKFTQDAFPQGEDDPEIKQMRVKQRTIKEITDEIDKINTASLNKKLKEDEKYLQSFQQLGDSLLQFNLDSFSNEIDALEDKHKRGIISEKEYNRQIAEARRKQAIAEKVKAEFDIAIQTAVAIMQAFPNPILMALAGVTGAAEEIAVASRPIPPVPGFAESGLSGKRISSDDGIPIHRNNGDNLLATVRTGEVILNERHQALLGGAAMFRAIGVPGFTDGGYIPKGLFGFADGGFAARVQAQAAIGNNFDMTSVVNAISDMNIFVRVSEINAAQGRVANIDMNRTV